MIKKSLPFLLIFTSVIALISSCKKDKTPAPATTPVVTSSTPAFSANINGTSTSWSSFYYLQNSGTTTTTIYAFTGTQINVELDLINVTSAGTYTIDGTFIRAVYLTSSSDQHWADSGTITISSYANNKVSGTFSFTENGGTVVTNGIFTDIPKH
jgi:hypothetical protein